MFSSMRSDYGSDIYTTNKRKFYFGKVHLNELDAAFLFFYLGLNLTQAFAKS